MCGCVGFLKGFARLTGEFSIESRTVITFIFTVSYGSSPCFPRRPKHGVEFGKPVTIPLHVVLSQFHSRIGVGPMIIIRRPQQSANSCHTPSSPEDHPARGVKLSLGAHTMAIRPVTANLRKRSR